MTWLIEYLISSLLKGQIENLIYRQLGAHEYVGWRFVAYDKTSGHTRAIIEFQPLTEIMAFKDGDFSNFRTFKKGLNLLNQEDISLVRNGNSKIPLVWPLI